MIIDKHITYTDKHTRQTQQKGHVAPHPTNVISLPGRVDHLLRVDKATPATRIRETWKQCTQLAQAVAHPVRPGSRTSSQARQSHIQSVSAGKTKDSTHVSNMNK